MVKPRYHKGDCIGDRYLVHQALLGGMGEVYLCLDLEENVPYALKTFQQRYLTSLAIRQLFQQEVGTWVALEKHPNIVRCFHMQTLDNQPFMVLEWIVGEEGRGTDLRSWLGRGPLSLKTALEIMLDVCRGLIHAQEKQPGIVHRDLKPENILMTQGGLAKVTDFGLAQVVRQTGLDLAKDEPTQSRRQTMLGAHGVVGTPPYMAPEQWHGESEDIRTDIYAVGCILYELLTGQFAYHAKTIAGFQQQHEQAPVPVIPADRNLPVGLNALLAGCLAKYPEERFLSVTALLENLIAFYQQECHAEPPVRATFGNFNSGEYSNRGMTYRMLGRLAEALADHDRAIQLDSSNAMVYNNRGNTYQAMGRYEDALADYARAIELNPTLAAVYNNRGATNNKLGQTAHALADYTSAILLDPTFAEAYANRGSTYAELGRHTQALIDYDRAIQVNPALAQVYMLHADTYASLGRIAEALADYEHTMRFDPFLAQAYFSRGRVYYSLERYTEALADFERTIQLAPADASAYVSRGTIYQLLGRTDEARAEYDHAIQLDSTFAMAYTKRGTILAQQGRWNEALPDFDQATRLGDSTGAELAVLVRDKLRMSSAEVDPMQLAFDAFVAAQTPEALRRAVAQNPLIADPQFRVAVAKVSAQQMPPAQRLEFERRLNWLREFL